MKASGRGELQPSARPLANPAPILIVVAIGAIAVIAAIVSILRHPTVPAAISEDCSRVAARLLLPEVQGSDRAVVARELAARQPALRVTLPSLSDVGYTLEGATVRQMLDAPGVVAIYRNRALDLVIAHAYVGATADLPGPPEVRQIDGRRFVIQRKATNILVFWQDGPVVRVMTSNLPSEQVLRLAANAAQSLDAKN